MPEPTFDRDGYPTEGTLTIIEEWDCRNRLGAEMLMEFVANAWKWEELAKQVEPEKWELITGGWSGNEDLVDALGRNRVFWVMAWEKSTRGGKHVFDLSYVPTPEAEE